MKRLSSLIPVALTALLVSVAGCEGCEPTPPPDLNEVDPNDVDGDGVINSLDEDIDGDGVGNIADDDVDGDGVTNEEEIEGGTSPYGDGEEGVGAQGDIDGDGVPNNLDNDDDGDGISDGVEGNGYCGDQQGTDESNDCDGFCVTLEGGLQACDDGAPPGSGGDPDSDGDGLPDPIDTDDDGDGIPDDIDPNNNGDDPVTPGEGEGEGQCTTTTFGTGDDILDPRILLVVDKSGSMGDPAAGFPGSKWDATRDILIDVVQGLDGSVDFGLMLYPNSDDGCTEGNLRVNVASNNAGPIVNELNNTDPGGGTPTAPTLADAQSILDALPADGGTRAVVLATDGGPNCNLNLDGDTCRCVNTGDQGNCGSQNCLDDSNAISSAAQLNAAGYPVFVIGVPGAENFFDVLNAMANAGGTALAGGNTQFYDASDTTQLANALDDIAIRVGACRFDLPQNVTPNQVTVTVGGSDVARDTSRINGWDLTDSNTIELFGTPCAAAVNGGAGAAVVSVEICPG